MDDPLLVGMLHRLADRDEQLQTLPRRQVALVAIVGDRDALDQLHHEVRSSGADATGLAGSSAAIEDVGDVRVVHQRQRLTLGLEPGHHLARVHARLEDLQSDLAPDRLGLLRHEDDAKAAFADLFQQLVGAEDHARPVGIALIDGRRKADNRAVERSLRFRAAAQKGLHALPQLFLIPAGRIQRIRKLRLKSDLSK